MSFVRTCEAIRQHRDRTTPRAGSAARRSMEPGEESFQRAAKISMEKRRISGQNQSLLDVSTLDQTESRPDFAQNSWDNDAMRLCSFQGIVSGSVVVQHRLQRIIAKALLQPQ